ncbi:MAG: hypothetical protein ACT4QF_14890 [Sporichthyaceae bacterium]
MGIRRLAAPTLCAVLVLAGCGGDDEPDAAAPPVSSAPSTPPSPIGAPSTSPTAGITSGATSSPSSSAAPGAALSLSTAKTLAKAGVLTSADLAGWTKAAQTQDAEDDAVEKSAKECLNLALTPYLHRDLGFTYTKGTVEVSSDADVTSTAEQATAEFAALGGDKAADCYRDALATVFPPDAKLEVEVVEPKVQGADDAIGFRLAAEFAGPAGQIVFSGYEIAALVGQTMIWLNSAEESATPAYKLADLTALAAKLVTRVDAAS